MLQNDGQQTQKTTFSEPRAISVVLNVSNETYTMNSIGNTGNQQYGFYGVNTYLSPKFCGVYTTYTVINI